MSESIALARITATPAAREAIRLLRAGRGGPVMFAQSGGCCAGSTPMCIPAGEFLIGDIDVLLGEIDGCPFYIDKRLDQAWHQEQFLLDVAPGEPEDLSLPAGDNLHFVIRSPPEPRRVHPGPGEIPQASPLRKLAGPGRTAGASLEAAARFLARGASGVWLRAVSRLGLVCRGTVYLLVGYLALRLALAGHGRRGAPASSAGAVQAVGEPSWGRVLLVLLVAGLGAYALTQLIEAVFRPSRAAGTMGRWRQRAVSWWGCLLYLAFCLSTARLVLVSGARETAGSEQRQDTDVTAALLRTGWGRLLLILVGVALVAAGAEVGRRSVRLDFRERFAAAHMSRAVATLTRVLGGLGCAARAVVFVLAGFFFVKAAVLSNPAPAKGLDAVFRSVASSAYGSWLLGVLASGLVCYGLYCLLEARYRDLTPGR